MPTYVFKCEKCENIFEESLKYEDRDSPTEHLCQKCDGNVIRIPAMPLFAYDNVGSKKPDNAFNDKLKEIKRTHYGSTINPIE
tara:strand:+ start:2396 stop:2644 length:249 start_codon:yes stop_codon:yes gene_type:complete